MNAQDHFNTSDVSDSHSDTSEDEDAINTENPIVIQLNIGDKVCVKEFSAQLIRHSLSPICRLRSLNVYHCPLF